MTEETDPSALTLHAMGEGVFNSNLGEAILSTSEKEILNPSLLAASMVTQFGLLSSAIATHNFNGGNSLEDAKIVKDRAEAVFTLASVFISQADIMLATIEALQENVIPLHGAEQ